jgi:hypothetical protein
MIVLATPKGWTGPPIVDGHRIEGTFRAHQIPLTAPRTNPEHLRLLEAWMRSYRPEELFTGEGRLRPEIATLAPIVLVAEGLEGGQIVLPAGAKESDAAWRVIVDPIDGTRGLMYQKRCAWVLTGVAPNRGDETNLQDIELAVQTEIPLVKQHLCDVLWGTRGSGAHAERFNRLTQERKPLPLRPSRAKSIRHGFAMIARFFPGARDELAAIDEEIVRGALGPVEPGKAHCFEDQYLSSGGKVYELMLGHDGFVADLGPLV